jgi:steroid delta-isomerase-like uncharacterized protein
MLSCFDFDTTRKPDEGGLVESQQLVDVVRRYAEALGSAEKDTFVSLFTEDVHFEDPVGTKVHVGHEGVAAFHDGLRRAWSSLSMATHIIEPRGDRVAVSWSALGRSASGKDITFDGIDVMLVRDDGRIARLEGYWDFEGVVAQM